MKIEINKQTGIVSIEPNKELSKEDFFDLAKQVDPFIEKNGLLKGILIHTETFPFWESFQAFLSHLRFVKDHHKHIKKLAICTNFSLASMAGSISDHFIDAQIKVFTYAQTKEAQQWLNEE